MDDQKPHVVSYGRVAWCAPLVSLIYEMSGVDPKRAKRVLIGALNQPSDAACLRYVMRERTRWDEERAR